MDEHRPRKSQNKIRKTELKKDGRESPWMAIGAELLSAARAPREEYSGVVSSAGAPFDGFILLR